MKMKRPLVWLSLSYAGGMICVHMRLGFIWVAVGVLVVTIILICRLVHRKSLNVPPGRADTIFLLLPAVLLLGAAVYENAYNFCITAPESGKEVQAAGKVKYISGQSGKYKLTLEDSDLLCSEEQYHLGTLLVYVKELCDKDTSDSIRIGNSVILKGIFYQFESSTNPGQFNSKEYYGARGINASINAEHISVTDNSADCVGDMLYRLSLHMQDVYERYFDSTQAGMLTAMLHGEKAFLGEEEKLEFQRNGISHIMAVSGLHISFAGLGVFNLLRRLRLRRGAAFVCASVTALLYACMTGFSVSSRRAVIMLSVLLLAKVLGKCYDMLSGTGAALFIVLTMNPLQLTDAGFLLSFGAVLGIAAVFPVLDKALGKPENEFKNSVRQSVLVCLSVQLTISPIILYFYYELPLYALLLNLAVVPLMTIIASSVFLLCVIDALTLTTVGVFLAGTPGSILTLYKILCSIAEKLPFHTISTGQPKLIVIYIYYAALCTLLVQLYMHTRDKKKKHGRAIVYMSAAVMVAVFIRLPRAQLRTVFLDVGQGDGIFIENMQGICCMVDGGSSDQKQIGRYVIEPFLKWSGNTIVDFWFVSHSDSDHVNGLIEILERMNSEGQRRTANREFSPSDYKGNILVNRIVLPCHAFGFEYLISLAENVGIPVNYMAAGDSISDGELSFVCESPFKGAAYLSANEGSLVLSAEYKQSFSMLLTGDVEGEGERNLTEELSEKNDGYTNGYDLLKTAHHGSKNSTPVLLLEKITPQYAVVSCGKNNRYGHPHPDTIARLESIGCSIWCTKDMGAVTVITDGRDIRLKKCTDILQ